MAASSSPSRALARMRAAPVSPPSPPPSASDGSYDHATATTTTTTTASVSDLGAAAQHNDEDDDAQSIMIGDGDNVNSETRTPMVERGDGDDESSAVLAAAAAAMSDGAWCSADRRPRRRMLRRRRSSQYDDETAIGIRGLPPTRQIMIVEKYDHGGRGGSASAAAAAAAAGGNNNIDNTRKTRRKRKTPSSSSLFVLVLTMTVWCVSRCCILCCRGFELYSPPTRDYYEDVVNAVDEDAILQFYRSQRSSSWSSSGNYVSGVGHKKGSDGYSSTGSISIINNVLDDVNAAGSKEEGGAIPGVVAAGEDGDDEQSDDNAGRQQGGGSSGMQLQLGSVHVASQDRANSASSFASSGSSFASSGSSSSSSCPPTTCRDVGNYDLLPVLPNCREYVLCQHGLITLTYSCEEGTLFDTSRRRCEPEADVDCACVDEGEASAGGEEGEEDVDGGAAMAVVSSVQAAGDDDDDDEYEMSTICRSSSELQPLLSTGCRDYVSCLNGEAVQRGTCAEGLLFDSSIKGCNWRDVVECPPYDGGSGSGSGSGSGGGEAGGDSLGYVDLGATGFGVEEVDGGDTDQSSNVLIVEPADQSNIDTFANVPSETIVELAEEEAEEVCKGQSSSILPLVTTGCMYYVSCLDDAPAFLQSCSPGMLFDIAMNGCNWEGEVFCATMSPTYRPTVPRTPPPTMRPVTPPPTTSRPTPPPSPGPTDEPTPDPTPYPTAKPNPVVVERATPPPTPATPRPTPRPSPKPESPDLFEWLQNHRNALNENVFKSYTKDGVSYRSYWFQYQDFIRALDLMARGSDNSGASLTGLDKHLFYVGETPEDWEYGLVNVAAFLAHAMTESISHDACDEFHWETSTDNNDNDTGDGDEEISRSNSNHYAISNSCGQNGQNYQEYACPADESHMACAVDRNLILQATTSAVYPNAPPPLGCRPRSTGESYTGYWDVIEGKELSLFPYENSYGRTDVEGCCYWGRGALHSKGICNLGKINYYLGKRAADENRKSKYPTTDFCAYPEAICAAPESREMRWITSMFEWTERVQSYDDMKGWNYIRKLKEFVDYGLVDFEFLEATSGILTKGCHNPPCAPTTSIGGWGAGEIHLAEERVENFKTALITLEAGGEEALLRALIKFFTDRTDDMNSQVLRSQTPQGQLYPSYRYRVPDFLSSLTYISETGVGGRKFYTGEARVPEGVRYGIVNTVMFLSQAYKESVQYDACDENNWQLVNDRFPLSNACGQLGMSYQDMHCREDEAYMECPARRDMEQVALTSALWFQAPGPLKCGPRSKYSLTGYWDYDLGRENNQDAYANALGRVDVEGCCWWGRGIIQTRGTCNYGKLNYYLGKRAASEGRPALYPTIDFCDFPQGVCSSDETYGGELQWMVGFFEWADRIQTYDRDGWNYIEKLKEFVDGGYKDFSFVDAVSGVLNIGCHDPPCKGFTDSAVEAHNQRERNDTFQRFLNALQVARTFRPPPKPTPMPSPVPTEEPSPGVPTTGEPTTEKSPTESPTFTTMPTALMGRPPDNAIEALEKKLMEHQSRFSDLLLVSEHPSGELWPSYLYTFDGFMNGLSKMTKGEGPGEKNFFYVGDGYSDNSLEYGLANVAAFIAEGVTQSIYYDACDENSWEMVNFRYPIANSCGQGGKNYQDDVCDPEEEDGNDGEGGMECEVDESMEVHGATRARWVGAPPPMYCGDRTVGYWDHVTGLEEHDPPFKNRHGRADIKGCCWWGRGVLQTRGVCWYGKMNHWLGAKAAAEKRPSIYPEIDFCKNPGVICSDTQRSAELRWVTGMFHWVQFVQRSRTSDYFPALKAFVDRGDYNRDGSFIGTVNTMLGGSPDDIARRTRAFLDTLRAFNLIKVETNFTGIEEDSPEVDSAYCGTDWIDAASKCKPCATNMDCTGRDICHAGVKGSCYVAVENKGGNKNNTNATKDNDIIEEGAIAATNSTSNAPIGTPGADTTMGMNSTESTMEDAAPEAMMTMLSSTSAAAMTMTNYCGETWSDAASKCANACPSGKDIECAPGQYCFGDITSCASGSGESGGANNGDNIAAAADTSNYCGVDWSDASSGCSLACPGGMDAECPPGLKCFGDISC